MLERLRALREDRDLSQQDLADFLHVHQTTYSDYELEQVNIPISALKSLSEFYQTSIDYILGMTDEKRPYPRKRQTP